MGLRSPSTGRIGQDAELKRTQNKTALLNVSVLVQDSKAADGQGQRVRAGHFGDDAEDLPQRLVKGSEVYIEGRLKTNVALCRGHATERAERHSMEDRAPGTDRPACAAADARRRCAGSQADVVGAGRVSDLQPAASSASSGAVTRMDECLLVL